MKCLALPLLCIIALILIISGCGNDDSTDVEYFISMDDSPMQLIPAGEFQMSGNPIVTIPIHDVYLDSFYMDIYEVTNEKYAKFLNNYSKDIDDDGNKLLNLNFESFITKVSDGVYKVETGYEQYPVIEVTWYGAITYANYYGKRLPTEAEWEKGARGGLTGDEPWGDREQKWMGVHAIGSFPINGYGLYDMADNVWEWCSDLYDGYDDNYYTNSPKQNPTGPLPRPELDCHVIRGGWHYLHIDNGIKTYSAIAISPNGSSYWVGFRCAMDALK